MITAPVYTRSDKREREREVVQVEGWQQQGNSQRRERLMFIQGRDDAEKK